MKKRMLSKGENRGITLVALVITIILLLILAGITIVQLTGSGLFEKAKQSKIETEKTSTKERIQLEVLGSYDDNGNLLASKVINNITKNIPEATITGNDFPITVTLDEYSYTIDGKGKVELAGQKPEESEKLEIESVDIAKKPQEYYGAIVANYAVDSSVSDSNIKWRIFYADGEKDENGNVILENERHIYLIASDYISYNNIPKGRDGISLSQGDNNYVIYFSNIINSTAENKYIGSSDITDTKIKALNKSYFIDANEGVGYSSTNNNMKSVAYMLDTNIWSKYVMPGKAEYAIGGPTLELLLKSYNGKNNTQYIARAKDQIGYEMSKDNGVNWNYYNADMISGSDNLYVISETSKTIATWLATPSAGKPSNILGIYYAGGIYQYETNDKSLLGFRPIICLKSKVQLRKISEGIYNIVE